MSHRSIRVLICVAAFATDAYAGQGSAAVQGYIDDFGKIAPEELANKYWHSSAVYLEAGQVLYIEGLDDIARFLDQGHKDLLSNGWQTSEIINMTECPLSDDTHIVHTILDRHYKNRDSVRTPVAYIIGVVKNTPKIHAITFMGLGKSIQCNGDEQ